MHRCCSAEGPSVTWSCYCTACRKVTWPCSWPTDPGTVATAKRITSPSPLMGGCTTWMQNVQSHLGRT